MVQEGHAVIRVGFAFEFESSWLGGVNYYRNLFAALYALPGRKIEPVIFLGYKATLDIKGGFPPFQIVRSKLLDRHSMHWWARRLIIRILARDILLEHVLSKNNINILSHSGSLGRGSRIPCLCWMPDFQHRRLPQFFEEWEIKLRDNTINLWGQTCTSILLSSQDAKKDLLEFFPNCRAKPEVLQFVSGVGESGVLEDLTDKCAASGKYFLVANQFWAHKNHKIIIDALKYLKDSGRNILVIATGNTGDYRQSGFYEKLTEYAKLSGVLDNFKILGVVPNDLLASLMRRAVAIINPSMFEGWSTSVEEAKSLGKQVVLSDIPVHREQKPARADFFKPDDAGSLAEILWKHWVHYDRGIDYAEMQKAEIAFPARLLEFGMSYQSIVINLLSENQ